jgi:hypothetical protein
MLPRTHTAATGIVKLDRLSSYCLHRIRSDDLLTALYHGSHTLLKALGPATVIHASPSAMASLYPLDPPDPALLFRRL